MRPPAIRIGLGLALAISLSFEPAWAERFRVGPKRAYQTPSAVAEIVRDGDVVEIDAGEYVGDVAVWRRDRLTLRGVGGRAHLKAGGRAAEGKAIWVIKGKDTTIEHVEFSGAEVPDGNGAGIRQEGAGLTLRDCYFHGNQNGILGGAGHVLIERSEFANNGAGDGYTHNIYIIDRAERFTLRHSYSHHARVGHNVKSRARENYIEYNRIMDEAEGRSSYAIDLPNGGAAFIVGNAIQQGPQSENHVIVSYGAEGLRPSGNELYVVNNTMVNEAPTGTFLRAAPETQKVVAINNLFVGPGQAVEGKAESRGNLALRDGKFLDRERYDYRLTASSPAVDAGVAPKSVRGVALAPISEYEHPLRGRRRSLVRVPDVGAYEFPGTAAPRAAHR